MEMLIEKTGWETAEDSDFHLVERVEQGLPIESIVMLKERGLTFSEISAVVISPRTLKHRKARGENLSHEEADRIVRATRIITLAETVFASHDKALLWLRTPDDRLAGRTPMSMLQTEAGGRLVEGMLWQIDEGVYT